MNERLQNALTQMIDKAMTGVDASVDFLSAEIPEVVHQLLLWYAVSNMVYAALGAVVLYLCYCVVRKPKGKGENWMWNYCEYKEKHTMTSESILGFFIIFPAFVGFALLSNVMESLKIWIAPKIWLIEYASDLVK